MEKIKHQYLDIPKNKAYLLLGGNVGDTASIFTEALKEIQLKVGNIISLSSLYQTSPWGLKEQPDFLNQALIVGNNFPPMELLQTLLEIEKNFGRIRKKAWGERTLDIDILLLDWLVIQEEVLTIPHPRLTERRFALVPLAEIAPTLLHPVENKTIKTLLLECEDPLEVVKINPIL